MAERQLTLNLDGHIVVPIEELQSSARSPELAAQIQRNASVRQIRELLGQPVGLPANTQTWRLATLEGGLDPERDTMLQAEVDARLIQEATIAADGYGMPGSGVTKAHAIAAMGVLQDRGASAEIIDQLREKLGWPLPAEEVDDQATVLSIADAA